MLTNLRHIVIVINGTFEYFDDISICLNGTLTPKEPS
jgi:hypothetical protein